MQALRKTQISAMDMPIIDMDENIFNFLIKYSSFLYDYKRYKKQSKYMQIPLDKTSIGVMIKDAKKELNDSEIKDILELIYVLLDSGVPKKEIWLKIDYDNEYANDDQQTLVKTRIAPIEKSDIKIDETVFQFITNYATYLYDDKGHSSYMKLSPDEVNFSKMEKDAEQELGKEKLNKLMDLIFTILSYKVKMKEDLWFEIIWN